ncbi:MAG: HIT family protein [Saprospiraceae bacterium]|nr:HIT family protein [Saprospiraceae bacterium]
MASIFTRIINGEIPCYKIAEDDRYFAFLDISPLAKGHTLVVPRQETDYLFDLDDELLAGLMLFSRRVAQAIEAEVTCLRIGVAVIGLEVPHAHVHLVPLQSMHDLDFAKDRVEMTTEEFSTLANRIAARFQSG